MELDIFVNDILNLFQDYKIEKHTDDEKGYEFLDVGHYFLTIKNPERASDLSIKLGKEFVLFFGGCQKEFPVDEEGYKMLIAGIRSILDCTSCVYSLRFEHKSIFAFGKVVTESSSGGKAPKNILDGINEFKKVKLKGSKLRLIAWQPEYIREFVF